MTNPFPMPPQKNQEVNLTYEVKCRKCGRIHSVWFSTTRQSTYRNFLVFITEHSNYPIQKGCICDRKNVTLHDIVSYTNEPDAES